MNASAQPSGLEGEDMNASAQTSGLEGEDMNADAQTSGLEGEDMNASAQTPVAGVRGRIATSDERVVLGTRRRIRTRGSRRSAVKPHRAFDPRRVGSLECDAWVAYYRHEWLVFLRAAIGLTRHTFGLPWPQTLWGAWLVLRANQLWAPFPDNDPDGARRTMERFYKMVARRYGETFDPRRAAELEVEWWRVHRHHQHDDGSENTALIDALAALYAYVYSVPVQDVRVAAEQRALAMDDSDRWVREGCDLASPLVERERAALVRSYAGLLAAVHR